MGKKEMEEFLNKINAKKQEVKDLVNAGKVHLRPLISKTFAFQEYLKAYQYIDDNRETTMKVIINVQE